MKSEKIIDEFFLSYMPTGGRVGDIRENRLARMEKLLDKLSHPEKDMKLIHVAGSKGKGSMTWYILMPTNGITVNIMNWSLIWFALEASYLQTMSYGTGKSARTLFLRTGRQ